MSTAVKKKSTAIKKAEPKWDIEESMRGLPRLEAFLREAVYIGPCVVQSPGAWTRVGPTWYDRTTRVWVTIGPGAAQWNTTSGIAQLALDPNVSPSWHETGVSLSPEPNLVFVMHPNTLTGKAFDTIRELADTAERWEASRTK